MNIKYKEITKELVDKAHPKGYAVHCWFPMKDEETEAFYEKMIKYGVDILCCNYPDKAKTFRDHYYANSSL